VCSTAELEFLDDFIATHTATASVALSEQASVVGLRAIHGGAEALSIDYTS
jgi:hypothetical protein